MKQLSEASSSSCESGRDYSVQPAKAAKYFNNENDPSSGKLARIRPGTCMNRLSISVYLWVGVSN